VKSTRSTIVGIGALILAACILLGAVEIEHRRWMQSIRVPEHAGSILDAVRSVSDRAGIFRVNAGAEHYIKVVGTPKPGVFVLPSGPPIYIFDRNGSLVDWTPDSGEDPEFQRAWSSDTEVEIGISEFTDAAPSK
jgi:hypothetical protein